MHKPIQSSFEKLIFLTVSHLLDQNIGFQSVNQVKHVQNLDDLFLLILDFLEMLYKFVKDRMVGQHGDQLGFDFLTDQVFDKHKQFL